MYAHGLDYVNVGVGLAFGEFAILSGGGTFDVLPVFPVADIWFRL